MQEEPGTRIQRITRRRRRSRRRSCSAIPASAMRPSVAKSSAPPTAGFTGATSTRPERSSPDNRPMPITVVGLDGDDTLWHNETRFNITQGEFRELLHRHAPDAAVDEHLFQTEMKNLGLYGYGIKSFTLSMIETAIQLTEGRIPATDLDVILGWGKRMLIGAPSGPGKFVQPVTRL